MTNNLHKNIARISSFGMRLKARRKELKLSQEAIGVAIGLDESCSRARISRYETGIHEPSLITAQRLANALQVPLVYLFCDRNSVAELILIINKLNDEKIISLTNKLSLEITTEE